MPGINYCKGWGDHAGMGISVIGVYDYVEKRSRVFLRDNFSEFVALANDRDLLVGFNSIPFDNKVLAACGVASFAESKCYDLLREIWKAAGLGPNFSPRHAGYGLNDVCFKNFGIGKTGHGAKAPIDWQQGRYGSVIDYCLQDINLTRRLLDAVLDGPILCPKTGNQLNLTRPLIHVVNDSGSAQQSTPEQVQSNGGVQRPAAVASTVAAGPAKAAGPALGR